MKRCTGVGILALAVAVLAGTPVSADETTTDVNIVTGLDISNSIGPDSLTLELAGMAEAIRDPRVLKAIQAGEHRRIGFAVFAWHHRQFPLVVPWMVIGSAEDARIAADLIEARRQVNVELEVRRQAAWYIGRLTDLSAAIDHSNEMLLAAPFGSERSTINIVGNGEDNVGEDAGGARDRFVGGGGTINGVVLGADPAMVDYYRQQVIGGRAAFVISADDSASIADALVRKFIGDVVASADGVAPRTSRP